MSKPKQTTDSSSTLECDTDIGLPGIGPRDHRRPYLRIVHTADNHLRLTHDGSAVRGQDFFAAAMSVVRVAERIQADVIINAGDFLNVPESYSLIVQQMLAMDARLRASGLPMYVVQGNHDFTTPSWVDVLARKSEQYGLRPGEGLLPECPGVLALPFLTPDDLRARLGNLSPQERRAKVLVWHGPVLEFAKFPSENIITVADLMVHPWEAVLLGDIHQRKYIRVPRTDGGQAIIGYPGATELCKRDEPLEHSCTVIDFDEHMHVIALSHVPVDHRKVIPLRINTVEELGQAAHKVRDTVRDGGRWMVLARYADSVDAVRHTLQMAAGQTDTIVRADSFAVDAVVPSAQPGTQTALRPMDYLDQLGVSLSTGLRGLCLQLAEAETNASASEQLALYCQNALAADQATDS